MRYGPWISKDGGKRMEPLTVRDAHSRYVLEMYSAENAKTQTVGKRFEKLFLGSRPASGAAKRQRNAVCFFQWTTGSRTTFGMVAGPEY